MFSIIVHARGNISSIGLRAGWRSEMIERCEALLAQEFQDGGGDNDSNINSAAGGMAKAHSRPSTQS